MTPAGVSGRPPVVAVATSADAGAVVALWHACDLTRPWNDPAADFALAVRGADSGILVLRMDDAIVGSAMVGFDGHRGWVYYLAVAAAYRRGGCGGALMDAAGDWLRARGAPKLHVMVRDGNVAALGFHAAAGLVRQDVVVLGRALHAGAAT